jgi:hypothetical protein
MSDYEYEYISKAEVEDIYKITLTERQWRTICSEMFEQPSEENLENFPSFVSVLDDVMANLDWYENEWLVWDTVAGQTASDALKRFEPGSTKPID